MCKEAIDFSRIPVYVFTYLPLNNGKNKTWNSICNIQQIFNTLSIKQKQI